MNYGNLFKIIALPVCLFAFGLASCEKDDPVTPPDSDSEQVLPGTAGEVTEAVTTEGGYALSYRSCIALPEGGSAEVDLTASLPASGTTTEEIVSNWDYAEEAAINSVYSGEFNREENGFIITDSLLVYTVSYGTFELTFEFPYETAQYDGTDVPEYRFEIKDKGGKFELIDSKERDGKAYALREYTHTVEAVFGGKSYEVSKSILLMRELGPANEPYLLSSEFVSLEKDNNNYEIVCNLTLYQRWSNGYEENKEVTFCLKSNLNEPSRTSSIVLDNYDNDLAIVDTHQTEQSKEYESEGEYFSYTLIEQKYIVEFNYNFDFEYEILYYDDIVYDDGVLVYKDFPDGSFVDFDNDFDMIPYEDAYEENGVISQIYFLKHQLIGTRGDQSITSSSTLIDALVHYK